MGCVFWHKWGPWSEPFWGGAAYDYQRRVCQRCGLQRQRIVGFGPEEKP